MELLMSRRSMLVLGVIVSLRVQAQTPPTTSPPSNPPNPTPVPAIAPATPVMQTSVPTIVLDSFDSVTQWTTTPAEGVEISVHPDPRGLHGRAMRVDFDFHGHGGGGVMFPPPHPHPPRKSLFFFSAPSDNPYNKPTTCHIRSNYAQ